MATGKYLSKSAILNAQDIVFEDVPVPEWGGVVRVKALTAAEKDAFETSLISLRQVGNQMQQKTNLVNVRAKLAAKSIVDEEGARIFDDSEVMDLGRKSAAALDRVVDVAKKLSRVSEADLKELTEGLKNDQPAVSPID